MRPMVEAKIGGHEHTSCAQSFQASGYAFAKRSSIAVPLLSLRRPDRSSLHDALIPIALVNKLVSLANHPSSKILQRFAVGQVH